MINELSPIICQIGEELGNFKGCFSVKSIGVGYCANYLASYLYKNYFENPSKLILESAE